MHRIRHLSSNMALRLDVILAKPLIFALWCVTSGCGIDFDKHLQATGLIGAVFRFHVYYQTRRLLKKK